MRLEVLTTKIANDEAVSLAEIAKQHKTTRSNMARILLQKALADFANSSQQKAA